MNNCELTRRERMKFSRCRYWLLAALAILLAGAGNACAFGCVINATSITFGDYRSLHPGDLVSTGAISYTCTGVRGRISIALDQGNSPSVRKRRMREGAKSLTYNLYLDPVGSSVWGDGTDGSQVYVARGSTDGATVRLIVYGKVPPRQDVSAGAYHDAITVNLIF